MDSEAKGSVAETPAAAAAEGPRELAVFDPKPIYLSIGVGVSGFVLFYLGFITHIAMIAAVLLCYTPSFSSGLEYRGGCPSKHFRKKGWFQAWLSKRLDLSYRLHDCTERDFAKVKQAITVIVPHGAMSVGHILFGTGDTHDFWTRVLKVERRSLAASALLNFPILREHALACGCIDASKESAKAALDMGLSLTVIPGGVLGQALARYGEAGMYVKNRKGFIKLALEHGCDLIPVYIFGETFLYKDIPLLRPISKFIATNLRIGIPMVYGFLGVVPFKPDKGLIAVVGKPILVKKVEKPDWEKDVLPLHAKYMKALKDLYEANKEACGYANIELSDFADEEESKGKPGKKKTN